jgi:hypothetical protein
LPFYNFIQRHEYYSLLSSLPSNVYSSHQILIIPININLHKTHLILLNTYCCETLSMFGPFLVTFIQYRQSIWQKVIRLVSPLHTTNRAHNCSCLIYCASIRNNGIRVKGYACLYHSSYYVYNMAQSDMACQCLHTTNMTHNSSFLIYCAIIRNNGKRFNCLEVMYCLH